MYTKSLASLLLSIFIVIAFAPIADQTSHSDHSVISSSINSHTVNAATVKYYYVGNKHTKVYHKIDCRYVKLIKKSHKVYFKTKKQAKKAGYRACKVCRP